MSQQQPADSVRRAVAALAAGRMVIAADDHDRENEGDFVAAAERVTDAQIAFIIRHSTGILCAPMTGDRCQMLGLPQMVPDNTDPHGTAFTVTVDHVMAGTGVSAPDRVRTLRALADPGTRPQHLRRPGHVFPLRAREGGVLMRAGHTEAAVDLLTLGGLNGVGVIAEITADDGSMMRGKDLCAFAAEHAFPILAIADLVRYRRATERPVQRQASTAMPTEFGEFRAIAYRSVFDDAEHLALVMGDVVAASHSRRGALVRVHSECLTGDTLASMRCDCGTQLRQALGAIAREGCGAMVYLRGHEGRGIGLGHKIRAYALQEQGLDTVDANTALGLPVDSRNYGTAAQILADLGVHRIRIMTNNPAKYRALEGHSLEIVERVPLRTGQTPHNVAYLLTKRDRMGHDLGALPPYQKASGGSAVAREPRQ